jgi:hypothetical protein
MAKAPQKILLSYALLKTYIGRFCEYVKSHLYVAQLLWLLCMLLNFELINAAYVLASNTLATTRPRNPFLYALYIF